MQRFKRILVVLEAGEAHGAARQELLQFAHANAAKVTVAACSESPEPSLLAALFDGRDHKRVLRAQMETSLEAFVGPLRDAGIDVATTMIEGDRLEGVCKLAKDGGFDLVAKLAEGNAPDAPYTFGPLDRGLLRTCPLPVFIANPHREERPRVLVAVDVNNPTHVDLNTELLAIGVGQATAMQADLHVVSAWRLIGETALRTGAFTEVSAGKLEQHKQAERDKRHIGIQTLLAPYRGGEVDIVEHIVEGSPPKAIAAVAKAIDSDLVVMGATGRSRLASMMLGDCAIAVLGSVGCSMLLIKTRDFEARTWPEA